MSVTWGYNGAMWALQGCYTDVTGTLHGSYKQSKRPTILRYLGRSRLERHCLLVGSFVDPSSCSSSSPCSSCSCSSSSSLPGQLLPCCPAASCCPSSSSSCCSSPGGGRPSPAAGDQVTSQRQGCKILQDAKAVSHKCCQNTLKCPIILKNAWISYSCNKAGIGRFCYPVVRGPAALYQYI